MCLPEKEEKLFWQELDVYEKEGKIPYITSIERIGYERGMQHGIQITSTKGIIPDKETESK